MSSPTGTTKACERYEQLRQKEAESGTTDARDRQFLSDHVEECADCKDMRTLLETIHWADDDAPIVSLDELSRRRLINDAVAGLDESPATADRSPEQFSEDPADPAPAKPASARPLRGYGLVAALSAALVVLAVLWSPWRTGPTQRLTLTPRAADATGARTLLLAGAVRTAAGSASLNQGLRPGHWLETSPASSAVLRLPCGATVLLAGGTRIRLGRADVAEVSLRRGALLALVDPQQPGARFTVVTAQGRVEVKGTVFGVTAGRTQSRAAVLRGRVQVTGKRRTPVQLAAGHQIVVGGTRATALPAETSKRLWGQVRLLDLLQTDRPATLAVTSRPAGARVVVDGVALGITPLVVALRPGHRRLELAADRYGAVREHVLLKAHSRTSRDFELKPEKIDPSSTAGTSVAKSGSPETPRSSKRPSKAKNGSQVAPRDLRRALLNRAQLLRAARDWRGAAGAYRELIRRYSGSAEAATALVSLGVLQLRHLGQPAQALRAFQRYLKRSGRGVLAREAAYGRILALRALGRRAPEIQALREFLKRYPRALRAAKVKRRLAKITHATKTVPKPPSPKGKP